MRGDFQGLWDVDASLLLSSCRHLSLGPKLCKQLMCISALLTLLARGSSCCHCQWDCGWGIKRLHEDVAYALKRLKCLGLHHLLPSRHAIYPPLYSLACHSSWGAGLRALLGAGQACPCSCKPPALACPRGAGAAWGLRGAALCTDSRGRQQ